MPYFANVNENEKLFLDSYLYPEMTLNSQQTDTGAKT